MALDCGERCVRKIQCAMSQMFWRRLYQPRHHSRVSTELHGPKFAVCFFFFRILSCFVNALPVPLLELFDELWRLMWSRCHKISQSSRRTKVESNKKSEHMHNLYVAHEDSLQRAFIFCTFSCSILVLLASIVAFSFSVSPYIGCIQQSTPHNHNYFVMSAKCTLAIRYNYFSNISTIITLSAWTCIHKGHMNKLRLTWNMYTLLTIHRTLSSSSRLWKQLVSKCVFCWWQCLYPWSSIYRSLRTSLLHPWKL